MIIADMNGGDGSQTWTGVGKLFGIDSSGVSSLGRGDDDMMGSVSWASQGRYSRSDSQSSFHDISKSRDKASAMGFEGPGI